MGLQKNETCQCFLWFNEEYKFTLFLMLFYRTHFNLKNQIVQDENVDDRVNNDFKDYKLETDFINPLEVFSFRGNCFTDHWLFLLTHSPSFANLKVIDLRENNIKFLLCLKVNHEDIYAPMLKELYIALLLAKKSPTTFHFYLRFCTSNLNTSMCFGSKHTSIIYIEKKKIASVIKFVLNLMFLKIKAILTM